MLLAAILTAPVSVQAQTSPVTLASAPTGTTNQTNPEIRVVAPDKVSYKYSFNGGPYSPELSIATPIRLTGGVELGGIPFTAGSRALIEFLRLRSTDTEFTDFLGRIGFDHLASQVQVTYTLNKKRTAVAPENVLNLQGAGVADLSVTLKEKTPVGPRFELSALAIGGGKLVQRSSSANLRRFTLWLPSTAHEIGLTPLVNNGQTAIVVNNQPSPSGQTVVLPAPGEGQSVNIRTVGPDSLVTTYEIEIRYDSALQPTQYRAYFLRAFVPASSYVSIHNIGTGVVDSNLSFNQKFGATLQDLVREIQEMAPEYPGEAISRKVWRFVRDNRYHADPLTVASWNHSPGLFFSSIGFGYCDDSASVFRHLMTALGYESRVWGLGGHIVAEVLRDNRWEMWDTDLQVYYFNRSGLVAGVEELAAEPDLILQPVTRLPGALAIAYDPIVAGIYSTPFDNAVMPWYDSVPVLGDSSMAFEIPPGGTFEFPDIYDGPLSSTYATRVPSYANARLIVPEGFSGTVSMPLVIQSIGWSNTPTLRVVTKDAQGNWDAQPTLAAWVVDAEPPFTIATQPSGVYNTQEPVTLTSSETATIYYTTDGATPSEASSIYTTPFIVPSGGVVKFLGVDQIGNRERERRYGGPAVQQVQLQLTAMSPTSATLSASASGGSGSYEYRFDLGDPSGNTATMQFYSDASVWNWDKSGVLPGTYTVWVCVRNRGTMGGCEQSAGVSLVVLAQGAPVLVNPGDQVDNVHLRSYADAVVFDHPVGYWKLDEDGGAVAVDRMGNHTGSRFGGIVPVQPGALADGRSAARFDGTTGYVGVPNTLALQVAGDLTIEMWVNVSLDTRQTLISKDYIREFELTLEKSGTLNLYQGNGTTSSNVLSASGAITPLVWQHVVVTRSAATRTVRFYVNGVAKGSGNYAVDPVPGTRAVAIGRSTSGSQYVNGRLDEIALYPAELTAVQVLKHYVMRLADGAGLPVQLPLIATDVNGDALSFAAQGLPPGLTINSSTGLISGTLVQASAGVYQVVATVSDGLLSHSQAFLWSVSYVNTPPILMTPAAQMHAENTSAALPIAAADPEGDPLTFSAVGLPPPLTIDSATGVISGLLSFASAGSYAVTVSASDGVDSAIGTFTWVVVNTNRAPVLVNPGAQAQYARGEYAMAVLRDSPSAYWRLGELSGQTAGDSAGSRPGTLMGQIAVGQPGALADGDRAMVFDGINGYIHVPGATTLPLASDLTIELWAYLSPGSRQTLISKDYIREFELTVETSGALNFYQGNGSAGGNVLSPSGSVQPNQWQHVVVTRTAATNTITFYVNGVIKATRVIGIAAAAGTSPISIGRAKTADRYVNGRLDEVALYPVALTPAQVAAHYARSTSTGLAEVTLQLSAFDPDGDVLAYSATGLPSGIAINPATGLVSGQPVQTGTSQVTVTVSDGALSDSESFTWTIERVNQPPVLEMLANRTSMEGASISFAFAAGDPDGDVLVYSATGLPASIVLDPATGIVAGTVSYTSAGEYLVTVTVSDGRVSATRTFTWVVVNTNRAPILVNPGGQTSYARGHYAMAVLRDNPSAYWRLGELSGQSAGDSAGSRPGTLMGQIAVGQAGALADGDRAMVFDGTNGYIHVPGAATLSLAGDLTIELWTHLAPGVRQTLISKDYKREFELTIEASGALNFYQGNGTASGNVLSPSGSVQPNQWQHVVVTRTAATNTITFYVNGVIKSTGVIGIAAAAGTSPISIGRAKTADRYVNGRLDEVALYPVALTPAQVAAHYAKSASTGFAEITLQLFATDPDGGLLSYTAANLPPGLTVHPQTGVITGSVTPAFVGTYQVTVTATDQTASSSQTFTWTVLD